MSIRLILAVCAFYAFKSYAAPDSVHLKVAVAANFTAPMKAISKGFEAATSHQVSVSFASSGKLYAQIRNGAPYHLFLSADSHKPQQLISDGLAMEANRITYARGTLVLWSAEKSLPLEKMLKTGEFKKLAIANPKLASYGYAAVEVLEKLGIASAVKSKLVKGDNIAQTYQFVSSGNAELGFVAISQVVAGGSDGGSRWLVPKHLYSEIRQDAVLLNSASDNSAAKQLFDYLQTGKVKTLIKEFGYAVD